MCMSVLVKLYFLLSFGKLTDSNRTVHRKQHLWLQLKERCMERSEGHLKELSNQILKKHSKEHLKEQPQGAQ